MNECQDSDSSNYNSKGNVTLNVNGDVSVVEDSCSGNNLTEMVCNSDGTSSKIDYSCEYGCSNGQCNSNSASSSSSSSSSSGGGSGNSENGGSTRRISSTSTTTTTATTAVTASNPSSTTSSNGNAAEETTEEVTPECSENSECTSNLCLNGACVQIDSNVGNGRSQWKSLIEIVCKIANPVDKKAYNNCIIFLGG